MEYLYHRVPPNLTGTILYPLNKLREIYPEIYTEQVKKYIGREELLTRKIPSLHCLWNDVLHLTAVSPEELKLNLAKAGIEYKPMSWFKIPVHTIEGNNSTVFKQTKNKGESSHTQEYETFNIAKMSIYRTVPLETIEYYMQKKWRK
jgi:hypothetical protein